jgi:hypothetical protein
MKQKNSAPLYLEPLEDRWVPATVRFVAGSLYVSNPLITGGTASLTLTQTANNTWQVKDGNAVLGTYAGVGNLSVTGSNAADKITVDLQTFTSGGNLLINSGNGNDTVALKAAGGSLRGSVTMLTGYGNDSVSMNNTGTGITIGGAVQISDLAGNDTVSFGNAAGVSKFLGNVTLTGMNAIRLAFGQADVFGGNFTASLGNDAVPLDLETNKVPTSVTIDGSLLISGGAGDDSVFYSSMSVNGDVNINLGESQTASGNFVSEFAGFPLLQVGGNYTYTGGSGVDEVVLSGATIGGNASLNLGSGGDDTVDVSTASSGIQPIIGGNLTMTGGNGNIYFDGFSAEGITAAVGGNLSVTVGSGNDTATLLGPVGGTTSWHSGNGNDSLTVAGAQTYNLNVAFGNGDDTFTLNNAAAVVTGSVNGGGRITGNVFNDLAGTLGSPFTLSNFP